MTKPWSLVDKVAIHLGVMQDSNYRWVEGRDLSAYKTGYFLKLFEGDEWLLALGKEGGEKLASKNFVEAKRGRP